MRLFPSQPTLSQHTTLSPSRSGDPEGSVSESADVSKHTDPDDNAAKGDSNTAKGEVLDGELMWTRSATSAPAMKL